MAWVTIKCPHCRYERNITVNPDASRSKSHSYCTHCHKPYYIETDHGKVKVYKS